MIDRDDLTFATCYQIAGEIKEDWTDRPVPVDSPVDQLAPIDQALGVLSLFNEPEEVVDTFHEPLKQVPLLVIICQALKVILIESDSWKTQTADMMKKEIVSRIKEYERRIKELTEPVLAPVSISL
jgi:nickel-dependent lactate racemase